MTLSGCPRIITRSTQILSSENSASTLSRSLTSRLDHLKTQYKRDLVPLTAERESLVREVAELKAARDVFLEETTMLNARNEELAQLNAIYARRTEAALPDGISNGSGREKQSNSFERQRLPQVLQPSATASTNTSLTTDESSDSKFVKVQKPDQTDAPATLRGKFKWRMKQEQAATVSPGGDKRRMKQHVFQQISVLRFTRCDHCGEKLWGSQARCTGAFEQNIEGCFICSNSIVCSQAAILRSTRDA
jgi:Rho-type GTPase-activating protein 1/2